MRGVIMREKRALEDCDMKGFLFKYEADLMDKDLKDRIGYVSCGCRVGLRDPDFWSNGWPVWGICGPYYRTSLQKGDVVFFVPKKGSSREANLEYYVCAGILVVDDRIPDPKEIMTDSRLTETYRRRYQADLNEHLKRDRPRTRQIRPKNFIIGNPSKSRWLGKHENYLRPILETLGFSDIAKKLSQRRIPGLNERQTKELYNILVSIDTSS